MIRLLVTGCTGQVQRSLQARGKGHPRIEVIARGRPDLDLEHPQTVAAAIAAARPHLVVNAAAYTAVDRAEGEPDLAFAINRDGAAAVARSASRLGLPLVQLSTDYVFAGDKGAPYLETDPTGPLNVYGASKLAGEQAVLAAHADGLILRTSWVYSPYGHNFVKTMLRLGQERDVLRIVDDQRGNPTSALDLADALLAIAPDLLSGRSSGGVFHLAGSGAATWFGLARQIFVASSKLGGPNPSLEAIATADYPTPARRPADSRLDTSAFRQRFGIELRPWQEAVHDVIGTLQLP
jgi:dTDP-4-dehydrorhamnose reductase